MYNISSSIKYAMNLVLVTKPYCFINTGRLLFYYNVILVHENNVHDSYNFTINM